MKKTIFIGMLLGMLSGCYTQFSTLDEKIPPAPKVTYEIDSATGDTVKVYSRADTLVKAPNQTCYWTRNLWGEPELRCDNSYYSQDWYLYNDYPWWYNRDPYMYDAYGRCPQYYYYDGSCGRCRYYSDRGNYYNGSGWGGSGRSSSVMPGNGGSRRTRSSGIPNINNSSNANLPKTGNSNINGSSGAQNTNQPVQTDPSRRTRSSAVPSSATIQESAPTYINQTPITETRTEAQAPVSAPPPQPASQPAPPPPDQSNTNVQSSPPPSQPSNNGGDQNHNHRNPRRW